MEEEELDYFKLPNGQRVGLPKGTDPQSGARQLLSEYPDAFPETALGSLDKSSPFNNIPEMPVFGDEFGPSDGAALSPVTGEEVEPNFFERVSSSFHQSLDENLRSIGPGLRMGLADFQGDQASFDAAASELNEISETSARLNPNPSSLAEVKKKYSDEGLFPAIGELVDLTAQGLGGSFGFMAPAGTVVAAGALGAGLAPWVGAASVGAGGLLSFSQYFADQLETSYNNGAATTEDLNLGNQLLSAAGQAALEAYIPAKLGAFKHAMKSKPVKDAANQAIAKTVIEAAGPTKLQAFLGTIAKESATEQGQNLLQRVAAGQSVTDQEAFDSYIETAVSTLLVSGAFGAVNAIQTPGKAAREAAAAPPPIDPDVDFIEAEEDRSVPEPLDMNDEFSSSITNDYEAAAAAAIKAESDSEALDVAIAAQKLQADLLEQSRAERLELEKESIVTAGVEVAQIESVDRTIQDIVALAQDRNIDIASNREAAAGFGKFVYDAIKKPLAKANASEIEAVYKKLDRFNRTDPSQPATVLPAALPSEVYSLAKKVSSRLKKNATEADIRAKVRSEIKNEENIFLGEAYINQRVDSIIDRFKRYGLFETKKIEETTTKGRGKNKVTTTTEREIFAPNIDDVALFANPDVRNLSDEILKIASETRVEKVGKNDPVEVTGRYPTFKEVSERTRLQDRKLYNKLKSFHERRGLIEFDKRRPLLNASLESEPVSTEASNRIEITRSKTPMSRWIVRNEEGAIDSIQPSKTKAQEYIKKNPNKVLSEPQKEKGYVIHEKRFRDDPDGKSKLTKARPVEFIPLVEGDMDVAQFAEADADAVVESLASQYDDTQSDFLGSTEREIIEAAGGEARIQRLARAESAKEKQKAINMLKRDPMSMASVMGRYGLGVELDSEATADYLAADSLTVPFNGDSEFIKGETPVVVKEGTTVELEDANGNTRVDGFGKARLDAVQDAEFAADPEFSGWRDALSKFFERVKSNPRSLSNGEVTAFSEHSGRTVMIWNRPNAEPVSVVLDYINENGTGKFHVYNAFIGNDYAGNVESLDAQRGVEPKRGPRVTTEAVAAAEELKRKYEASQKKDSSSRSPSNRKKKRTEAEEAKHDMAPRKGSIVEQAAKNLRRGDNLHKGSKFVDYLYRSIEAVAGPKKASKMRKTIFDKYDQIVKKEMGIVDKNGLRMIADARAESAARFTEQAVQMLQAAMPYGTTRYRRNPGGNGVEGVFVNEETSLHNETESEVLYFDPDSRRVLKKKFAHNLYNDRRKNKTGGIQTILLSLTDGQKSLVPELFEYMRALRSYNISKNRKLSVPISPADINRGLSIPLRHPEVAVAYSNFQKWNQSMIDLLVDTHVLSKEEGQFWGKRKDYTPFVLDMDAEVNAHLKNEWEGGARSTPYRNISAIRDFDPTLQYTGIPELTDVNMSDRVMDPLEATLRNAMGIMAASSANIAKLRTIRNEFVYNSARDWENRQHANSQEIVVLENGEKRSYEVDDDLMWEVLKSENKFDVSKFLNEAPILKTILQTPAHMLRETVTRNPGFMIPNTLRDSLQTLIINGTNPRMMLDVWKRIGHNIRAMNEGSGIEQTRESVILNRQGVTTGYEHVAVAGSPKEASKKLNKLIGRSAGKKRNFNTVQSAWDFMGQVSTFSESATREEVYNVVYGKAMNRLNKDTKYTDYSQADKEVIAQAEAAEQAREILNFSRRGTSQALKFFSTAAPFINARLQGMDLLFRAAFKIRPVGIDTEVDPDTLAKGMWRRGMTVAAVSAAMAMASFGDDEYERQEGYNRDDHWFLPIPGFLSLLKIPIPFELGVLFKTIPEQIVRSILLTANGEMDQAGRDAMRAATHAFTSNFAIGSFIPVSARPFVEFWRNRSLHTNIPIESYWDQSLHPSDRYRPTTTAQARMLGQVTGHIGISPKMIDAQIRTVFGGLGVHGWNFLDHILRTPSVFSESYPYKTKPAPRVRDLMLLRRIVTDEFGRGHESEYYEWKQGLDDIYYRVKNTPVHKRAAEAEKYGDELRFRELLKPVNRAMSDIRAMENALAENPERLGPFELSRLRNEIWRLKYAPLEEFRRQRKLLDQMD